MIALLVAVVLLLELIIVLAWEMTFSVVTSVWMDWHSKMPTERTETGQGGAIGPSDGPDQRGTRDRGPESLYVRLMRGLLKGPED